jgi:hypothetical protein
MRACDKCKDNIVQVTDGDIFIQFRCDGCGQEKKSQHLVNYCGVCSVTKNKCQVCGGDLN